MTSRVADSSLPLSAFVGVVSAPTGDATAVEEELLSLFDAFRDPLLRYVCSFGLPISEAEDVVQDAFLALFGHLRRNGARTNLRGWLFRVAHNLALKRRARQRREEGHLQLGEAVAFVVDPRQDPEEQLALRQRRARATAVLSALSVTDRRCVYLRSGGLRYREIAVVLGISLGSVSKSLTRSIARVQRAIGG